jgi:hypothetical protein
MLQAKGYVNRVQERIRGFPEESIWPTDAGLARAAYLNPRFYVKAFPDSEALACCKDSRSVIAVVTKVITLTLSPIFRFFGLGQ